MASGGGKSKWKTKRRGKKRTTKPKKNKERFVAFSRKKNNNIHG